MATGAAGDVTAEVVKQWRARADELRGLLESTPRSDPWWRWRAQFAILSYLLHRHAGIRLEPLAGSCQAEVLDVDQVCRRGSTREPAGRAVCLRTVSGEGKAPRSSQEIRRGLNDIHMENRERTEVLERLCEAHAELMRWFEDQRRADAEKRRQDQSALTAQAPGEDAQQMQLKWIAEIHAHDATLQRLDELRWLLEGKQAALAEELQAIDQADLFSPNVSAISEDELLKCMLDDEGLQPEKERPREIGS